VPRCTGPFLARSLRAGRVEDPLVERLLMSVERARRGYLQISSELTHFCRTSEGACERAKDVSRISRTTIHS
jgi:hypothetical protein